MVNISPAAVAEIKRIQFSRKIPDIHLRLMVKSGGCLDFFYELKFETGADVGNVSGVSGEHRLKISGINLAIDHQSWQYVESLQLDYVADLMGGGFRFHNPQNQKTCGCGISFCV
ncbi:MAG: iron-sulfur cluster assembly accessory protein [Cyanobacteria bacterium P01_C01_bin.72]